MFGVRTEESYEGSNNTWYHTLQKELNILELSMDLEVFCESMCVLKSPEKGAYSFLVGISNDGELTIP